MRNRYLCETASTVRSSELHKWWKCAAAQPSPSPVRAKSKAGNAMTTRCTGYVHGMALPVRCSAIEGAPIGATTNGVEKAQESLD